MHEDGTLSKGEPDGWRGWSDWPEEEKEEDGQEDGSWPEEVEGGGCAGGRFLVKRRVRLVEGLVRLARREEGGRSKGVKRKNKFNNKGRPAGSGTASNARRLRFQQRGADRDAAKRSNSF